MKTVIESAAATVTVVAIAGRAALLKRMAEKNLTSDFCLLRPAERSRVALGVVIKACDNAIELCAESCYETACENDRAAAAHAADAQDQLDKGNVLFDSYADGSIYGDTALATVADAALNLPSPEMRA